MGWEGARERVCCNHCLSSTSHFFAKADGISVGAREGES